MRKYFYAPLSNNPTAKQQLHSDIVGAVDEILHLAGKNRKYTDREFSDFVKKEPELAQMNAQDSDPNALPAYRREPLVYPLDVPGLTKQQRQKLKNDGGDTMWSAYWHNVVYNVCTKRSKPPF